MPNEKLIKLRDLIKQGLPDEPIYGFTPKAGLPIVFDELTA